MIDRGGDSFNNESFRWSRAPGTHERNWRHRLLEEKRVHPEGTNGLEDRADNDEFETCPDETTPIRESGIDYYWCSNCHARHPVGFPCPKR